MHSLAAEQRHLGAVQAAILIARPRISAATLEMVISILCNAHECKAGTALSAGEHSDITVPGRHSALLAGVAAKRAGRQAPPAAHTVGLAVEALLAARTAGQAARRAHSAGIIEEETVGAGGTGASPALCAAAVVARHVQQSARGCGRRGALRACGRAGRAREAVGVSAVDCGKTCMHSR